jgi:chromosome segregation ATPase
MVLVDLELAQHERDEGRKALDEHRVAGERWADELHRLREEKKELNRQIAMLGGDSKAEVVIKQIKAEKDRLAHDLAERDIERQQVEDAAGVLRRELHGLRHELVEAESRAEGLAEAEQQLKAAEERLARTQLEMTKIQEDRRRFGERVEELERQLAAADETERHLTDEIARGSGGASRSEPERPAPEKGRSAAAADELRASLGEVLGGGFRDDNGAEDDEEPEPEPEPDGGGAAESLPGGGAVENGPGELREDERFGPIYRSAPDECDDLLEIKGVGQVILEKLHEAGI